MLAACAYAAETPRPQVSDTALEDALNDKRFIQRQLKCALGEAPCDPIGKRLKSKLIIIIIVRLAGGQSNCTTAQTQMHSLFLHSHEIWDRNCHDRKEIRRRT